MTDASLTTAALK